MDWQTDKGFFLNGCWLKIHGVCLHHDYGALGAVENRSAAERRLRQMKEMGVNAIRITHNPASSILLDVAAKMGLLIQEEAFDTWYGGKKEYTRCSTRTAAIWPCSTPTSIRAKASRAGLG